MIAGWPMERRRAKQISFQGLKRRTGNLQLRQNAHHLICLNSKAGTVCKA
jgi:hypothetical protein